MPAVDKALRALEKLVPISGKETELIRRCEAQRIERCKMVDRASEELVGTLSSQVNCRISPTAKIDLVLGIASSEDTHWRYTICATRCLRTLVRRDAPLRSDHVELFLDMMHDDNPTVRYVRMALMYVRSTLIPLNGSMRKEQ